MVAEPDAALPAIPTPRLDRARLDRAFAVLAGQVRARRAAGRGAGGRRTSRALRGARLGSEADRSVGTDDRFLIASVTKPIVAVTVLQLVDEGALTLAEPIRRLVPEFDPPPVEAGRAGAEIVSAWHLLTHTSGVVDADWERAIGQRATAAALLAETFARPLAFVPGSAYQYSSDSFFLLAELVRRVDGTAGYAALARGPAARPARHDRHRLPTRSAGPPVRAHRGGERR